MNKLEELILELIGNFMVIQDLVEGSQKHLLDGMSLSHVMLRSDMS